MEKERKGCLLLIGFTVMASAGIYIALRLQWPFLRNLMYLTPALVAPYVDSHPRHAHILNISGLD